MNIYEGLTVTIEYRLSGDVVVSNRYNLPAETLGQLCREGEDVSTVSKIASYLYKAVRREVDNG